MLLQSQQLKAMSAIKEDEERVIETESDDSDDDICRIEALVASTTSPERRARRGSQKLLRRQLSQTQLKQLGIDDSDSSTDEDESERRSDRSAESAATASERKPRQGSKSLSRQLSQMSISPGRKARRRGSKKLFSRQLSQIQLKQYGIEGDDSSDDECESDRESNSVRAGLKEAMSRRLSQIQLKQYGIEDDDSSEDECKSDRRNGLKKALSRRLSMASDESGSALFVNTMGMEKLTVSSSLRLKSCKKDVYNKHFESMFEPKEMRCLALVAHNHMKPAMRDFVNSHKEVLRKFRLTGTNTTMTMLREAFGDDPSVQYGPEFSSGPLGGDAELCALMCLQELGACIFFQDPLTAHPHQADIESLCRLCNVHNILTANNPCTAHALCFTLKAALEDGRRDMIPSFFCTLKSPGVSVYKEQQKMALDAAREGKIF